MHSLMLRWIWIGLLLHAFGRCDPAQGECEGCNDGSDEQTDDSGADTSGVDQPVEELKEGLFKWEVHGLASI